MVAPLSLVPLGLAALGIGAAGTQQATQNLSPDQKLELLKKAGQLATGTSGIMSMKDKLPEKKKEEEEEKKPEPEFEPDIPDLPKKKEEEYEKKIGPRSPTELDSMNVRVGTTEGNLKGVDAGIEGLLLDLNNSGYITTQSDSGIMEDYKESERGNQGMGYISFWNDENSPEKLNEIKDAAEKAGLVVNPDSKIFFKDALTIRTDITKDGSIISQLRKKANQSAAENLINLGLAKEEDFGVYTGTLTSSKNEYDPYAPKSGTKTSKGERLFDIWLDERDKITKNLIKDAGGPLSDKDVKSKWVSFYNNLFDKPIKEEESLKPNEIFFKQLSGVKNHNVERDPNDLFQEGWQNSFFAQPKALGKLGDYTVVIDQMKRSDNNFLLVKDGEIFGNIEVSAPMGKGQEKTIELDAIGVPKEKQGKGIAKDILRNLFSLADANDITIQGSAQPFGSKTLNKKQLVEFYKSMGFEGDANNLVRKPVKLVEKAYGGFIDKPLYDTKKDIF